MRKGLTHLCSQLAGDTILEAQSSDNKVDSKPPPGLVCAMKLSQAQLCGLQAKEHKLVCRQAQLVTGQHQQALRRLVLLSLRVSRRRALRVE